MVRSNGEFRDENDLYIPEGITTVLEQYVCCLYGYRIMPIMPISGCLNLESTQRKYSLPPSYESLYQHILTANFASYISKNCTINPILNAPSPSSVWYGWSIIEDTLEITWGIKISASINHKKVLPAKILMQNVLNHKFPSKIFARSEELRWSSPHLIRATSTAYSGFKVKFKV